MLTCSSAKTQDSGTPTPAEQGFACEVCELFESVVIACNRDILLSDRIIPTVRRAEHVGMTKKRSNVLPPGRNPPGTKKGERDLHTCVCACLEPLHSFTGGSKAAIAAVQSLAHE